MTVATHRSGAGVATNLFEFDLTKARADGYAELSVNWHDSDEAIQSLLMAEKTPGVPKFQFGAAILPQSEIHRIANQPISRDVIDCERQPLDGNPYHGNLLLKATTPKPLMRQIAATIALAVTDIVSRSGSGFIRTPIGT